MPGCFLEEKYFKLDERVRAEMAAPITEGGRTVGALNVDSWKLMRLMMRICLLVLISNEASRVLENMDDSQLRKKADQLQSLVLLSQDIGTRKFDEVLETISREGLLLDAVCPLFSLR